MKKIRSKVQVISMMTLLAYCFISCEKKEAIFTNPIIGEWENFEVGSNYSYLTQFTFNNNFKGQMYYLEKSLQTTNKHEQKDSLEWSTVNGSLEITYIKRNPLDAFMVNYEIINDTLILSEINEETTSDKIKFIRR